MRLSVFAVSLFLWPAASFTLRPAFAFSKTPCEGEQILERVQGEAYKMALQTAGSEWVASQSMSLTSRNQLEKMVWAQADETGFIPQKFYGATYKYSVTASCEFRISKMTWQYGLSDPKKDINHILLAGDDKVYTAGTLVLLKNKAGRPQLLVTNQSTRFCPPAPSLQVAQKFLEQMGWKKDQDFKLQEAQIPDCAGKRAH